MQQKSFLGFDPRDTPYWKRALLKVDVTENEPYWKWTLLKWTLLKVGISKMWTFLKMDVTKMWTILTNSDSD